MSLDWRDLTPGAMVQGARLAVLVIGFFAIHWYLAGVMTDRDAGEMAIALGLAVLLAAPCQRGAELLGAVAIWLTTCEFMAATHTGEFALWRWVSTLAALALVLVITRVPRYRALARTNPWRSLGEHQRCEHQRHSPTHGPGAAWQCRASGDQVPAAMADIDGRARRIGARSSRSA